MRQRERRFRLHRGFPMPRMLTMLLMLVIVGMLFMRLRDPNTVRFLASNDDEHQVVGNAVCALNDQGFHFHVRPPAFLTAEQGSKSSEDTEALVMGFSTASGNVFMNVALRYHRRRAVERAAAAV